MLCSSYVGSWIDSSPSRILPLLTTISTNHGATTAAYMCWAILAKVVGKQTVESTNSTPKVLLYIAILFLDAIQELSTIGNRLSLELDCVPALVDDSKIDSTYTLTQVNSVMRRIDMICKLIAPTVLPLIVGTLTNHAAWISLLAGITMISWGLEIWCAGLIAQDNARLCRPKEIDEVSQSLPVTSEQGADSFGRIRQAIFDGPIERLRYYFSMAIWPASLSLSIIQLTVLAYSATLMTFMLNIGFSLTSITIARASASILALASTFITPMIVKHMKKRQNQKNILDEESIVRRVGLWGIISQFLCLVMKSTNLNVSLADFLTVTCGNHHVDVINRSYHIIVTHPPFGHTILFPLALSHRPLDVRPHGSRTRASRDPYIAAFYLLKRRAIPALLL